MSRKEGAIRDGPLLYAAALATVCVGTMFLANPAAIGLTRLPFACFVAGCIKSYNSLEETPFQVGIVMGNNGEEAEGISQVSCQSLNLSQ